MDHDGAATMRSLLLTTGRPAQRSSARRCGRRRLGLALALLACLGVHCTASSESSRSDAEAASAEQRGEGVHDEAATPVTYENLYWREAYWPYHVEMTEPWKPEGFEGERLGWGIGVLVRVEPEGDLRVDFGRFGKYRVPARVTNVVEEANRIRLGERPKDQPNFVLAAINKLVDPTTDPVRYLKPRDVRDVRAYLLVAADPASEGFAAIAAALADMGDRSDVVPVLLPQGRHRDDDVLARCKAVGWTHPFAHSRYAEAFERSILGEDASLPSVMLQTPEGRVLYTSRWSDGTADAVAQAIEEQLGATAQHTAQGHVRESVPEEPSA
jgi:hypothetical protein